RARAAGACAALASRAGRRGRARRRWRGRRDRDRRYVAERDIDAHEPRAPLGRLRREAVTDLQANRRAVLAAARDLFGRKHGDVVVGDLCGAVAGERSLAARLVAFLVADVRLYGQVLRD